jgi:hypothetical protein
MEHDKGVNVCPLSVSFDWRADFEPVDDLGSAARDRYGMSDAEFHRLSRERTLEGLPRLRGIPKEQLDEERDRFGFVWSPYAAGYAAEYERRHGPLEPAHPLFQTCLGDITGEPGMLQCVILLLNSKNLTAVETVPAPERLNKQRARKGREPLLGYSTIRIKLSRTLAQRAGAHGERNPARVHVVSGHFKVRKSGVYWWNDHTRGDPTQGVIRQQKRKVVA